MQICISWQCKSSQSNWRKCVLYVWDNPFRNQMWLAFPYKHNPYKYCHIAFFKLILHLKYVFIFKNKIKFKCLYQSLCFPLHLVLVSQSSVCCNSSFFSCKVLNLIAEICHSFLYATWHELMMMNESNKAQIFSVF